VNKWIYVEHNI